MKISREGPATIYDIAALAGLSISTVSRVIKAPERVNEPTRAKVLSAIDQLGYIPKAEARARALQNTRRIGVLTPFFTAPSFVRRLRGIANSLVSSNFELIVYTVESLRRLKGHLASLPLRRSLDGLIVLSLPFEKADGKRFIDNELEVVLIEYRQDFFSSVEIDDIAGGKLAARYLLDKGHQCLAFIGDINPPDYAIRPVINRLKGYRQGLAEGGVPLSDDYVRSSPYEQELSRQAARELLKLPQRPTAIFAAADVQAIAAMKVAGEFGLKIPTDLAILGFDDLDIADYVGLTTIRQPLDDSGRIATELLLERLSDPTRQIQHVQLPLSLVERETV